jgi:hypothetical protein
MHINVPKASGEHHYMSTVGQPDVHDLCSAVNELERIE